VKCDSWQSEKFCGPPRFRLSQSASPRDFKQA
jgi:hypothetical protein